MSRDTERIQRIFTKARQDPEYADLTEQYKMAQQAFDKLVRGMADAEQDIVWEYVCLSDQMNWRILELMCEWHDNREEKRH